MKGFHKIRKTCRLAAHDGIKYAWVDTCCIDKSNSAELSEAINSMYKWYKNAKVCYAYLSDLRLPASFPKDMALEPLLRKCRWFSRGWTLQELIAPADVRFYQHDWGLVGDKREWYGILSGVTGISSNAMTYYVPASHCIAERMSWAAGRETTREEDKAYCLLGIFDVNMPMLYGEGSKAFRRLQEEIIRTGYDVSIFAWSKTPGFDFYGAFADAPGQFHSIPAGHIRRQWNEVSITNAGVKLTLELCLVRRGQTDLLHYILPVSFHSGQPTQKGGVASQRMPALGVGLRKISPGIFARNIGNLVKIPDDTEASMVHWIRCPDAYIFKDPPDTMSINLSTLSDQPYFAFPQGCKVVKTWPSDSWDHEKRIFLMAVEKPKYGSILLEAPCPMLADDDPTRQCRTREFMFLFSGLLGYEDIGIEDFGQNVQYTIVGYREHQLMLDTFNLRIGAGDMDVKEMRRTLGNFGIPRQRTAAVRLEGTERLIYTSVDLDTSHIYTFSTSLITCENERQPWYM
ncbi:Vegetative incompatibility protein HET-E-1 [Colletotrichum sp. SAR 10_98]|nr:Vegetative incompatibility protein HET-E-1 [Colletotrichum sp. SAR 10_98]